MRRGRTLGLGLRWRPGKRLGQGAWVRIGEYSHLVYSGAHKQTRGYKARRKDKSKQKLTTP